MGGRVAHGKPGGLGGGGGQKDRAKDGLDGRGVPDRA